MEDPVNEFVVGAASLVIGLTGAAGTAIPRRLAPTEHPEPSPLENAHVAVSLDHRQEPDSREGLHLVVENCAGPPRDIDVALRPLAQVTLDKADQADAAAEGRPTQRVRLPALDQGERRAVPVTALPGPVVAATCRWRDAFAATSATVC